MSTSAGSGLRKSSASRNAVHLTTFSHYSVFGRIPSACLTNQLRMRLSDWEERGVEAMQCASSAAWASSPQGSRTISEFDGRDVVLVITPSATGGHTLSPSFGWKPATVWWSGNVGISGARNSFDTRLSTFA